MLQFKNPVFEELYKKDCFIDHAILQQIINMGPEAVPELERMLDDWLENPDRYEDLDEYEQFFIIHALYLLYTIDAQQSFDKILKIYLKGLDFINIWLDDMIDDITPVAIKLGRNHTKRLMDIIQDNSIPFDVRAHINPILCQIALHYPEKRKEATAFYKAHLRDFISRGDALEKAFPPLKGDSYDPIEYISFLVIDLQDAYLINTKAEVVQCYRLEMIDGIIAGEEEDIDFEPKVVLLPKDIFEKYEQIKTYPYAEDSPHNPDPEATRRANREKSEEMLSELFSNMGDYEDDTEGDFLEDEADFRPPASASRPSAPLFVKPGRNDPCPCGSGKKYKKCHGQE
jgi:hypothetical protein